MCTYFWYFTAPRRFVMLLMRVFVNWAIAVLLLLLPKSDMLVRYIIDAVADEHTTPLSLLPSTYCSSLLCWLPSLEYGDEFVLVEGWLTFFHGKSDAFSEWTVLFEKCVVDISFGVFLFRFCKTNRMLFDAFLSFKTENILFLKKRWFNTLHFVCRL